MAKEKSLKNVTNMLKGVSEAAKRFDIDAYEALVTKLDTLTTEEMDEIARLTKEFLPLLHAALDAGCSPPGTDQVIGLLRTIVHLLDRVTTQEKRVCSTCRFHSRDDAVCCYEIPMPQGAERRANPMRVACKNWEIGS